MSTLNDVPDLTKWPRLLVVGEPVTREQANEILIRTAGWDWMHCNDRAWTRQVNDLAGIQLDEQHGWPKWESVKVFNDRCGVLPLEYLQNSRIASSWIGGPHGWCDWDGQIGCSTHNIGKWPDVEDVATEWGLIADAFPYLSLRSQLVPNEGEGQPAVEFAVADGVVQVTVSPSEWVARPQEPPFLACLAPNGERGVSAERLSEALNQVRGGGVRG